MKYHNIPSIDFVQPNAFLESDPFDDFAANNIITLGVAVRHGFITESIYGLNCGSNGVFEEQRSMYKTPNIAPSLPSAS